MQRFVYSALFFFLFLCVVSCQNKPSAPLKVIRLNIKGEPATLDPRKGGDVISSHMHFLLFEGLTRLNRDGSISPSQAESYEISPDGHTYTFHLRNAKWSDGSAVTAYDYETSWKDILDPLFPSVNAHLLYPIKNAQQAKKGAVALNLVGIQAKDSKTLVVTLEKPTPYFLDLVSFCVFFPVNTRIDREHRNWAVDTGMQFTSNGPFVLKEWRHNNEIIAVRNPHYWNPSRVVADQIHFSMIDNETTAFEMFQSGSLDMVGEPLCPLPADAISKLNQDARLHKHPDAATTIITFNTQKPPFDNVKIRKAFAYAINRQEIVDNITQCGELAATCAVPPILKKGGKREFFTDNDRQAAQALLKEGMQESNISVDAFEEISLCYSNSDLFSRVAQAIQQQWAKTLGITLRLENVEHKLLMDKLTKRDYTIAQSFWMAQYNDPMNILERFKFKENAKNYPHWENLEYIRLLNCSFYEDKQARLATLEEAEEIFLNEMPLTPIYHWDMVFLISDELENVELTSVGSIVFEALNLKR